MEFEHVSENPKVLVGRSIEVEPEEAASGEQRFDGVTVEADLAAAVIVDDMTNRRARPIQRCGADGHDGAGARCSMALRVINPLALFRRPPSDLNSVRAGSERSSHE